MELARGKNASRPPVILYASGVKRTSLLIGSRGRSIWTDPRFQCGWKSNRAGRMCQSGSASTGGPHPVVQLPNSAGFRSAKVASVAFRSKKVANVAFRSAKVASVAFRSAKTAVLADGINHRLAVDEGHPERLP